MFSVIYTDMNVWSGFANKFNLIDIQVKKYKTIQKKSGFSLKLVSLKKFLSPGVSKFLGFF